MAGLEIKAELVACFVLRKRNQGNDLLLLQRLSQDVHTPGVFQIIYGHVLAGESAIETVRREIQEETGLAAKELFSLNETLIFYDRYSDCMQITPVFVSFIDDIEEVKINDEHSTFEWIPLEIARGRLPWKMQQRAWDEIVDYLNQGGFPGFMRVINTPSDKN